jgi:hypothetical protein
MRFHTEFILRWRWNWLYVEAVADALLAHQTLNGSAVHAVIRGRREEIYDQYDAYRDRIADLSQRLAAFCGMLDRAANLAKFSVTYMACSVDLMQRDERGAAHTRSCALIVPLLSTGTAAKPWPLLNISEHRESLA